MAALASASDEEFCSPPGLGGVWRVKHLRSGLARGVIVRSDGIIAFVRNPHHGLCENCAAHAKRGGRAECTHCNCSTCIWEREVEEKGGPKVTRAKMQELAARLRAWSIVGPQTAAEVPLLDD